MEILLKNMVLMVHHPTGLSFSDNGTVFLTQEIIEFNVLHNSIQANMFLICLIRNQKIQNKLAKTVGLFYTRTVSCTYELLSTKNAKYAATVVIILHNQSCC